jgi:flagellar biosynthesis chaperone FliJ
VNPKRVDTVLRVRRLQERLATVEVARRRAELAAADRRTAAAWAAVSERSDARPRSVGALVVHRSVLADGVDRAQRLDGLAAQARADVTDAVSAWEHAARRRDGIERLDERLQEVARVDGERRAIHDLDELVVTRWSREQS